MRPQRLLGAVGSDRLEQLASDQGFLDRLGAAKADLDAYLGGERWYSRKAPSDAPTRIAYLSPEFGITAVLPQYSGGLGILAGDRGITVDVARDQLEDASRRAGIPVVALARVVVELHHDG